MITNNCLKQENRLFDICLARVLSAKLFYQLSMRSSQ